MKQPGLITILEGTLVALRGVEFSKSYSTGNTGWSVCPECESADWKGHKDDCVLAKQIAAHQRAIESTRELLAAAADAAPHSTWLNSAVNQATNLE